MKRFLMAMAIFFMLYGLAMAGTTVTLQWDANTAVDLKGYRVFQDGEQQVPDILCGPGQSECCTWESGDLEEGKIYLFYVIAFDTSGFESGKSNIVDNVSPKAPIIRISVKIGVEIEVKQP